MFAKVCGLAVLLLSLLPPPSWPQTVPKARAEAFIQALVGESADLETFVDPEELRMSGRLGIQYEGVKHKFLISYDIDSDLKERARDGRLDYEITIDDLPNGYSRLLFVVPGADYRREFYFKGNNLVSPISYYARKWTHLESAHFHFIISDTLRWNAYCADNLERFYSLAADVLAFSPEREERIKKSRIYYILCKNQEEIKQVTGFYARGMFNLAFDCIITTFNAHYHELLHLLINYRLERLPLYTHPFFQEGFAVAFGGRGGKEPAVILELGLFLYESQMLDYGDILSAAGFHQHDVSLSYPVSGLYNRFLIDEVGIERYLELYRKYSGASSETYQQVVIDNDLPRLERWKRYLNEFSENKVIAFDENCANSSLLYKGAGSEIRENCDRYYFRMADTLLVHVEDVAGAYASEKFAELFSDKGGVRYKGEKYLLIANSDEISIYNLYTNNLIAHYAKGFSTHPVDVPTVNGLYVFSASKKLFDEGPEGQVGKKR